jgi:hypothetical protein
METPILPPFINEESGILPKMKMGGKITPYIIHKGDCPTN